MPSTSFFLWLAVRPADCWIVTIGISPFLQLNVHVLSKRIDAFNRQPTREDHSDGLRANASRTLTPNL
jgi:hypothetical protein